jgi:hypothetical protein
MYNLYICIVDKVRGCLILTHVMYAVIVVL